MAVFACDGPKTGTSRTLAGDKKSLAGLRDLYSFPYRVSGEDVETGRSMGNPSSISATKIDASDENGNDHTWLKDAKSPTFVSPDRSIIFC